jgi:ribosomal-protein-alanine N-acetyltransferase
VRVSNDAAQSLYQRFGFAPAGVRKGYYAETGEDAIVMWVHDIGTDEYAARLAGIESSIRGRTILESE